jgi:uncharacterized membrane protein YdcZ (DUF606 family)
VASFGWYLRSLRLKVEGGYERAGLGRLSRVFVRCFFFGLFVCFSLCFCVSEEDSWKLVGEWVCLETCFGGLGKVWWVDTSLFVVARLGRSVGYMTKHFG